jgi:hypothetical protein
MPHTYRAATTQTRPASMAMTPSVGTMGGIPVRIRRKACSISTARADGVSMEGRMPAMRVLGTLTRRKRIRPVITNTTKEARRLVKSWRSNHQTTPPRMVEAMRMRRHSGTPGPLCMSLPSRPSARARAKTPASWPRPRPMMTSLRLPRRRPILLLERR